MTITPTAVEHGMTVELAALPAGQPRMRATCVCGWTSQLVPTPAHADALGQAHIIREATEFAREVRERIEAKTISTNPTLHGMPVAIGRSSDNGGSPDSASPMGDSGPARTSAPSSAGRGAPTTATVATRTAFSERTSGAAAEG